MNKIEGLDAIKIDPSVNSDLENSEGSSVCTDEAIQPMDSVVVEVSNNTAIDEVNKVFNTPVEEVKTLPVDDKVHISVEDESSIHLRKLMDELQPVLKSVDDLKSKLSVQQKISYEMAIAAHKMPPRESDYKFGLTEKEYRQGPAFLFGKEAITKAAEHMMSVEIGRIPDPVNRKKQHYHMIHGFTRWSYVKNVNCDEEWTKFIDSVKDGIEYRRLPGGDYLFVFKVPDGYTAYTDQVKYSELAKEGKWKQVQCGPPVKSNGNQADVDHTLFMNGPLRETKVVSFIYNEKLGLVAWKPGIFVDTLDPEIQSSWVEIVR
jgi:hypothetical protein